MSRDLDNPGTCQVDFYVLKQMSVAPEVAACNLALTMWERNQQVYVVTETRAAGEQLDELMWRYPQERFLPHAMADSQDAARTPVKIGLLSALNQADVVINLGPEAIPEAQKYGRMTEMSVLGLVSEVGCLVR